METIKISEESLNEWNHNKNVVSDNRKRCPLDGKNLDRDCIMEGVFDNGDYLRGGEWDNTFVGYVDKFPAMVDCHNGSTSLVLTVYDCLKCVVDTITERLSHLCDEDEGFSVEVDYKGYGRSAHGSKNAEWICRFFYENE